MRALDTILFAVALTLGWLGVIVQCLPASDSSSPSKSPPSTSPESSSQTLTEEPGTPPSEHGLGEIGNQIVPAQPLAQDVVPQVTQGSQQTERHFQAQPVQFSPDWRPSDVLAAPPLFQSEYAFWQALPKTRGESSGSRAPIDPFEATIASAKPFALPPHGELRSNPARFVYPQHDAILSGRPLTPTEWQEVQRTQTPITNLHPPLYNVPIRSSGWPTYGPVRLPVQAGATGQPIVAVDASAGSSGAQAPQQPNLNPTNAGPSVTRKRGKSRAVDPISVQAASPVASDHGLVLADPNYVPPFQPGSTPIQHKISRFRFPNRTPLLRPPSAGRASFTNIVDRGGGYVRYAVDPELATSISTPLLSGQRLIATKDMWRRLGMRVVFAKDNRIAYALADPKTLKQAFPTMADEDKIKLSEDRAALIEIEKDGTGNFFRLFGVLDPKVLGRV
ncbi:hypothetical protein PSEUBRA_001755 [Kalmanozyma brasiliensis GHG001]|uniref:uncharacterized protein n=1 Tax=Kalmanozyma brasiliensis (strain GHG001) TaxID=1365824 RepID=UPI002868186F|nr:uncharacterized protein PSEUBRA_001755 [Kalmanozyma brasiliensis GHG001]KAF6766992.1 hypothetical protein PSEUBRA_001755 [Kalmanozyma brasiliensis GHG001]